MSKVWIKGEEITAEKLNETAYGLHVVSQDPPDMTVRITSGVAIINSVQVRYTGGDSPTITAPSANPRIDLIVLKEDGTIEVIGGTENASPTHPLYPADKLVLAEVYLRTGMTEIKATDDASEGYISLDARPVTGVAPSMPTAVMFPFAGSSAPAGFVLCDGSAISRSTYAALYAIIGTVFGAGDGSTTFNVPDMRGSMPIGAGQKSGTMAPTTSYSNVDTGNDWLVFSAVHRLRNAMEAVLTSSGDKPKVGYSSGSVSVDGGGYISIGQTMAYLTPVGTKMKCTSQSSSNFVVNTDYYVISNDGYGVYVSTSPGGGTAGSGNSGSVTMNAYVEPYIGFFTDSYPTPVSGDQLNMAGISEPLEVGDFLFGTNSISISGVSQNNSYYVVDVDLAAQRFKVSSSPGGSPISVSGSGWISFNVLRKKVYVMVVNKTTVKLASSLLNAQSGVNVDLIEQGSGTLTLTQSFSFTNRSRGEWGGEEDHVLSTYELPPHRHPQSSGNSSSGSPGYSSASTIRIPDFLGLYTGYVGSGSAHENMSPFVVVNYIIKT